MFYQKKTFPGIGKMKKIGYLIPEFPGQTHTFIWREISHLREWGSDVVIFATRRPDATTLARHRFAESAAKETYYLWPQSLSRHLGAIAWALFNYPKGFTQMLWLCFTLKLDAKPAWHQTLPLLLIAPILAQKAQKQNIQHLNCQSAANSAILCMMVKRLVGIPFSMVCNAHLEGWGGGMSQKISDAEFTVAVARWIFDDIMSRYPTLKPNQIILAHHGVDTEKWKPSSNILERVTEHKIDTFRIVSVGRLNPAKGHDVLIKSIKILIDEGRQLSLKIIGSGPAKDSLASLIDELAISKVVTLTGSQSEEQIMHCMSESDAFALASHHEPLGVVFMEAMAMGLPTIGTNAGGVPEIISHQEDGLLVPPNDIIALKQAIENLMDNPKLRQALSINCRTKIIDKFDSRIGAKILYDRLYVASPAVAQTS